MKGLNFYIVDVFAERKYAGNQLAVVRGAKDLADKEMQAIAKEMNYSETTFILSDEERDGGYDVRIFTPETEVPFAGHPTLGTAYVIQEEILEKPVERVVLNLKVGKIPVTFVHGEKEREVLWMKQVAPRFGRTFEVEAIAGILNLDLKEIDGNHPIEEVSTGLFFIIVPLKRLDALKSAKLNREKYFPFIKDTDGKCILMFCPQTREKQNNMSVRVFAEYYGVSEDPATGSANGCLAGYLVKNRYFGGSKIDIRVEQGHEIGRPSLLLLRAEEKAGKIDVFVGGTAILVAKGKLV